MNTEDWMCVCGDETGVILKLLYILGSPLWRDLHCAGISQWQCGLGARERRAEQVSDSLTLLHTGTAQVTST